MYEPRKTVTERAILVGVITQKSRKWEVREALNELELLARTAGAEVVGRVTQSLDRINPATYIGKGKVQELRRRVQQEGIDLIIFDDDLSSIQIRNLERLLKCKLLDRTGLILDIFATRARTSVAKTQVELAQLEYMLTRLTRQWTHLSRQKGGIGTKGPGETQIETDRRLIRRRLAVLRDKLERIDRQRATQRKGRSKFVRISLVGYTNAGKSTLMNALSRANVVAEDKLFATLDATTRTVYLNKDRPVLLSDTVGFIRKLPHRLIESFKSTLDEVRESDLLLHVVDATHPGYEEHIRVVNETLKELGADKKKTLLVFNKVDAIEARMQLAMLREAYPEALFISAERGIGLEFLKSRIMEEIQKNVQEVVGLIPLREAATLAYLYRVAEEILDETYLMVRSPESGEEIPMARLHLRVSDKHLSDVDKTFQRFNGWEEHEPEVTSSLRLKEL